jgi:tyrosine-protein kinase Etk/Wzc
VRQNVERKSAEAEKSLLSGRPSCPAQKTARRGPKSASTSSRNQGTFDLGEEGEKATSTRPSNVSLYSNCSKTPRAKRAVHYPLADEHWTPRRRHQGNCRLEQQGQTLPNTEQDLLRLTRDDQVNGGCASTC